MAIAATWGNQQFFVGDTVRILYRIKEGNKTRTQPFEGVVIAIRGREENKTFVVRRIGTDGVGIERIFPLNSPWIADLKVVQKPKRRVRRAKLYYLRERHRLEP